MAACTNPFCHCKSEPDDSATIGDAIGRAVAQSIDDATAAALADPDTCDCHCDAIASTKRESYTLA
jgi:hypothetical protein